MRGRILAVDPGEVRTGLAISDPTQTLARPLCVLHITSRTNLALEILKRAHENDAQLIVVGVAFDLEGAIGPQARRALRLVEWLRNLGPLPIETWDESGSTRSALRNRGEDQMTDARAAAYTLQEYLDAQKS